MTFVVSVKFLAAVIVIGLESPLCNTLQNSTSLYRWKRESCGENQYKCKSGECISAALVCDGEKNCADRSDETSETCINSVMPILASYLNPPLTSYVDKCPSNQFRCDIGKCIPNEKRCDNRRDCSDGSDEKECESLCSAGQFKCRIGSCILSTRVCDGLPDCSDGSDETFQECQPTSSPPSPLPPPRETLGCVFPSQPVNGIYKVGGCEPPSCNVSPGPTTSSFALLTYICNPGFKLSGQQIVWCNHSVWSSAFPTCVRALCPALVNPTRYIECTVSGTNVNCSEPMMPGTKAIIKCESFHTSGPELSNYNIECREDGEWSDSLHSCKPQCGFPNPSGLPFIANGRATKVAEFPWHVGIFQRFGDTYRQMCGGSIINSKVVVTAAHCFWNENEGRLFDVSNYRIAAGKYYIDWSKRTPYVQESEIEEVIVRKSFRGYKGLYTADIAVVILKNTFLINNAVQPICIDFEEMYSENFIPGITGIIVGWGFTENQTQSDVLQTVSLPYENRNVCEENTKESFQQFLTVFDKFCVGTTTGKSVCQGDSGGGFAVKFRGPQYYLMGIVSAGVVPEGNDECDISQYSSFTKVPMYYSFIKQYI